MSQVAFAAAIGVTNVAVARWEIDKRKSPVYLRLAVAALISGLEPWAASLLTYVGYACLLSATLLSFDCIINLLRDCITTHIDHYTTNP